MNLLVVYTAWGFLSSMPFLNALIFKLNVTVKCIKIAFENGTKVEELEVIGTCGRRTTGTTVHFKPNPKYFDSKNFFC